MSPEASPDDKGQQATQADPLREWYSGEIWGKRAHDDDALFEVGEGQGEDVAAILSDSNAAASFGKARQWHDLAGQLRCVAGKRSPTL